jgi:hypothetical protein
MNARPWIIAGRILGRARAWEHVAAPGLVVRHCGHPTALRPYYVDGMLRELGTFSRLRQAQAAAELALAATLRDRDALASESTCRAIVRQVLGYAS